MTLKTEDLLSDHARSTLDPAQYERLLDYARLIVDDRNAFHTTEELASWVDGIREHSSISVTPKPIDDLERWSRTKTGELVHDSGQFFSVMGITITGSAREVAEWDQPMVHQQEPGVLGIVVVDFDGVDHYLLHAKAEPGNTLVYQLSPTLQATYSNLKVAHGGRRPRFAEFFEDDAPGQVLYRQWLAEDGGRFYLKSNLNMLVRLESDQIPEFPDEYRWFTLSQIKELLLRDNYINPHVRGILCHL